MFLFRIMNGVQASPLVHPRLRTIILGFLGLKVARSARLAEHVFVGSRNIVIGEGVFINVGVFIDGSATVTFAERARIGPYVKILTGTHSFRASVYRRKLGDTLNLPVTVERGCWVGMGAILMPGVTIAEGCVIAAGSVVTRSTLPNGLYAGVPAVRKRDLPTSEDLDGENP